VEGRQRTNRENSFSGDFKEIDSVIDAVIAGVIKLFVKLMVVVETILALTLRS
jgi:hypothetical protein